MVSTRNPSRTYPLDNLDVTVNGKTGTAEQSINGR